MPTLLDGSEVASDSDAWRMECEARHVAGMPTLEKRRDYLADIERRRGCVEADKLRATVAAVWKGAKHG
jgi:hypothetical protein